ncbi:MAG: efflux RND transporter periplasmic adaptor subunit [bacterium]|nr:efflux RND transporter periplasmic adaptor subunit [bacterium]
MGRLVGSLATLIGIAAVVAAVLWLRAEDSSAAPAEGRRAFQLPVTLATATEGEVRPRAQLTGTVRAPARAQLAFAVPGVLVELAVREVDRFAAGDVLARLEATEQELLVAEAEADHVLAQRELERLQAGTREEEVERLAAQRDVAVAEEALAAAEVKRGGKLFADRNVSEAELDRLEASHQAAVARTRAAEQAYLEARAGTRVEDIAIAEAKVALAAARVEQARNELKKTELRPPSGGVVLARSAAVGDYLSRGDAVLEVVDSTELQIEVEIPSRFATRLGDEPRVTVRSDDIEGLEFDTKLDAKLPVADERSRNSLGLIRLGADDSRVGRLEPGMFLRVELYMQAQRGCVVPADAVRTADHGSIVSLARRDEGAVTAELVPVRVLASDGERAVVQGLTTEVRPGDEVVVTGVDLTFPGAVLLPRAASQPAASDAAEPK